MNKTPQTIQLHTCHSVAPALSSGAGHQPRTFTPWDGRRPFPPGKNQRLSTFLFSVILWFGLLFAQHAQAYYAAEFGRWINRDPIGEDGGYNLYLFNQNNTVLSIDAFGHATKLLGTLSCPTCFYECNVMPNTKPTGPAWDPVLKSWICIYPTVCTEKGGFSCDGSHTGPWLVALKLPAGSPATCPARKRFVGFY